MNKKIIREKLKSFQKSQIRAEYENISFSIVLVQPEHAGNIGSIARVMKIFDFKDLVVFNPKESVENILSYEAQGFAMHGKEILINSEIITVDGSKNYIQEFKKHVKKYDLIIATTAKGSHYSNLKRLAIFPEDLTIPISEKPLKIAILFGKESRGLTNEEIEVADIFLRIPTGEEYPTLNISHACGIILYELFKKTHLLNIGRGTHPVLLADREERRILYRFIDILIEKVKIRNFRKNNVLNAFKNVFERSIMSKKELRLITGLFSKISSILKDINLYED